MPTAEADGLTPHRLALAEEQARLHTSIVEQGFSAVLVATAGLPDPKVVYMNPAFEQATGYARAQMVGQPLNSLVALTSVQERLRAGMPQDKPFMEEIASFQHKSGERWGEWRVGPVKDESCLVTHWLIIFRDITEQRRLEREIVEIMDRERQRLGQDLHDGLCQHLAGVELMSQVLHQQLEKPYPAAAEAAGNIALHVRSAISEARLMARGLSPVTLEAEGLASALSELAATTEKFFNVCCKCRCEKGIQTRNLADATHLFRIAQESVSNAVKHGRANQIAIHLLAQHSGVNLCIEDNGIGFPISSPTAGMGLRVMQYRAAMVRGRLFIERLPTAGIRVTVVVPWMVFN